jgi:hypothetical protein
MENEPKTPAEQAATESTGEGEQQQPKPAKEVGGREGLEPTRYGDWEKNGRCIDF